MMNDYFEAIAWCMERISAPHRGISMRELSEWISSYNDEVRAPKGESPLAHSRANLYRKFSSVDEALERTRSHLVSLDRPVPSALESYLITAKKPAGDPYARVWNADSSIEVLERALERARRYSDDAEQVILAQHLAEKLLRTSGQSDKILRQAYKVAETGYKVAESSPSRSRSRRLRHEQMLCARAAAWAAVRRSRVYINDLNKTDRFLYLVETWKRREAELARSLRLPITARVARFHAERASALIRNDREESIASLRDVARFLVTEKPGIGTDANDRVRYHDLTSIVQRLCAVDWAFSTHPSYQQLIDQYFPDGNDIPDLVEQLLQLYADDERGRDARADAEALIKLKTMNDALLREYEKIDSNPSAVVVHIGGRKLRIPPAQSLYAAIKPLKAWTFLRVYEHSALHALALARYAVAVHDIEVQDGTMLPKFPIPADRLLTTARDFCQRASSVTRRKTVDQSLLERVTRAEEEIDKRLPAERYNAVRQERKQAATNTGPEFRDGERAFPVIAENALTSLVLQALTSERLDQKQADTLANAAQTIHRYLVHSRSTSFSGGIDPEPA
ncbi:hypothetical protein K3M35_23875 [Rhodococcus sp. DMU2021]|uniref:hypothetical protein n=1 Tax=Rhodococcus sp. DMU2021 TaxID=2866997 RepID=UPI001C7CD29E|nr:hypothetical protein [Rhodococcus sp. DMU2021]MBX4171647.1 hypothetical protein [Rhodococcus sp. DMU2021]